MTTKPPEALRLAGELESGKPVTGSAAYELRRLHALSTELQADMKAARQSLQVANDTKNGPINDTIWHGEAETLFDFMDYAIAKAEGREA